ncbi:MAG: hypothetical protein ACYS7M_16160 [Planctomycetota bacterium]|jgi:hypothetical protein
MLASDFRNDLNYTLNSELHVRPDRLPSGVQSQAFELGLNRLLVGYQQKKGKLLGSGAIAGMTPAWQQRIQSYIDFIDGAMAKLAQKAAVLGAAQATANATSQGTAGMRWNIWSGNALQNAADSLMEFGKQVQFAVRSAPLPVTLPASFVSLSKSANVSPPALVQTDMEGLDLFENTTWHVPAVVGIAAGSLGVWWLLSRRMGSYY